MTNYSKNEGECPNCDSIVKHFSACPNCGFDLADDIELPIYSVVARRRADGEVVREQRWHIPSESTCVLIIGTPRSGTSILAKILSILGVDFGPTRTSPSIDDGVVGGYYEDLKLCQFTTALTYAFTGIDLHDPERKFLKKMRALCFEDPAPAGYWLQTLAKWTAYRERSPLWGVKLFRGTQLYRAWRQLRHVNLKWIYIGRQFEARDASVERIWGPDGIEAVGHIRDYCMAIQALELYNPQLTISYEQLVEYPRDSVETIAHFVDVSDPTRIDEATRAIWTREEKETL